MKVFKILSMFSLVCLLAPSIISCGDSEETPAPPALGTQIDRVGRPAVSTALIQTFQTDDNAKGQGKNAYNANNDPSTWDNAFKQEIAANLAIYDALDTVCGNQILAGPDAVAGRYDALAGVLVNDQLVVNSASGDCSQYLAVEANVTGLLPNNFCGGRTPTMEVIDVTYSVLAIGAFNGVTDGINADNVTHSNTSFPFLGAPL